jgi:hypothetical protein
MLTSIREKEESGRRLEGADDAALKEYQARFVQEHSQK